MIIKEWRCLDCSTLFESSDAEPECPSCAAGEPERTFLTPPAIKDAKTTIADRELKNLAADFGMSDMSNKHGQAVKQAPAGGAAPQFAAHSPQTQQLLGRLGNNADGFSSVLPALRATGGPRQWHKEPLKR